MKTYYEVLNRQPLFFGIDRQELEDLLLCLAATRRQYRANELLLLAGDPVRNIGVLLKGQVSILNEDIQGHANILATLSPPEMFAEVFICAGVDQIPVTVLAKTDCEVLWIDYRRMLQTCAHSCAFHQKFISNMLLVLAQKNLLFSKKLDILSKRSTREKILCYLSQQQSLAQSSRFSIPLNREELARYLCVDRSALSAELGKLQRDGLIRFQKNWFEVL